jgi:hypothetical protein
LKLSLSPYVPSTLSSLISSQNLIFPYISFFPFKFSLSRDCWVVLGVRRCI